MTTKNPYQYGESPEHVVYLTENQALAVNGFVFYPSGEEFTTDGKTRLAGEVELPEGTSMSDYNSAADILNEYIRIHGSIPCTEEYLENHDILTPIGI